MAPKKDAAKPSTPKLGVQKKQESSHEAISYRHVKTRSQFRYFSCKKWANGVSNQKNRGPTGRGDGGGQCGFFVAADLVTVVHRMKKRIGMDSFMSAQCGLEWGINLMRVERMFQEFCTDPMLGFETTADYPYEGVPRELSTDWAHSHRKGVLRYTVDSFTQVYNRDDFRPAVATNFEGPKYPCFGVIKTYLLENQPKLKDDEIEYHAILIVGADFRSANLREHTVHIKNSWGKDWGDGGFADVRIDLLSYIGVPHYTPPV